MTMGLKMPPHKLVARAMTLGGGADYRYNEHLSFRGQVEYLRTHFGGTGQNNARIEAGIVYRWGAFSQPFHLHRKKTTKKK